MRFLLTIGLIGVFALVSCKKPTDRKCWKATGEESVLEIQLPNFNSVLLGAHLRYELVQDTVTYARVIGGENLLKFVSFDFVEGQLQVKNNNKCSFLRSYKKELTVELHIKDLDQLQFEGTKELVCKNQLTQDYVSLIIRDGAGKVNLDINCLNLNLIVTHGWGNFDLKGQMNYLKLETNGSGFGTTNNLIVNDSLHVVSNSSADVRVNADGALFRAQTKNIGSIYYKGNPSYLEFNKYGEGELYNDN